VTDPRKWTRLMAALALALAAGPALAEWQRLDGRRDLVEALSGAEVDYDGAAWQEFLPSGRTVYRVGEAPTGSSSQGDWRVENDSYCSRWPSGRRMDLLLRSRSTARAACASSTPGAISARAIS
jgi:hypothetical protein